MEHPNMLCFGPQIPQPPTSLINELRSALQASERAQNWLSMINSLTQTWTSLNGFDPSLKALPGPKAIADLSACLDVDGGVPEDALRSPPNIFSMPFTILVHAVQYTNALRNTSHDAVLKSTGSAGVQGLCIGLLSALAVSCARDEDDLLEKFSKALQLSFVIGAYIDIDGQFAEPSNTTVSLAVRWRAPIALDHILQMIQSYPSAYLSVIRDATDVNITVAESDAHAVIAAFKAQDIAVKSTDLQGRCHTKLHTTSSFEKVVQFVSQYEQLQLPQVSELRTAVRSNADGQMIQHGNLSVIVLRCVMVETAQWYMTFAAAAHQLVTTPPPVIAAFGPISFVPPSLVRSLALKVWRPSSQGSYMTIPGDLTSVPEKAEPVNHHLLSLNTYPDNAVAVVGMACRFPGADSVQEFWDLLRTGASMAQELPQERFAWQNTDRSTTKTYWGNFVRDIEAFDHRFFKKSAREAASTDPQQRILLEVAYQALESSGYFGDISGGIANDIGCYLGVCSSDYNDNIASHPPTAYSSLGSLRAFLSGKISHYFGFTGPSVTYDTACSSSAVAINAACQAIQLGECSQAIAGGVSLYTSPYFYQNLTAGGFLSPTGQTKPFDATADGYCRGEGVGLVILKRLSAAVAHHDKILGVIGASAVNQNRNCTAITVPEFQSQVSLYQKALTMAGLHSDEVTFIEAHGTGTKVGDPIELESIRKAFGGRSRKEYLDVASVKGNIGHLEGASGVAALIKVLLMLQTRTIPVQASHTSLNPNIPALEPDMMRIPRETKPWTSKTRRVACCNNYGAAGSNATIVVMEAPDVSEHSRTTPMQTPVEHSWPVCLYAASEQSLRMLSNRVIDVVTKQRATREEEQALLASIAFALARMQNHELAFSKRGTVGNLDQLVQLLASTSSVPTPKISDRPALILAFGGQISNKISVSKSFYNTVDIFRHHLDQCNNELRSLNMPSIYPDIFEVSPAHDVVKLHAMLFSIQYASARSWIDCGARPKALVGHSFGELTALVVSGSLSLIDGLRLVVGRALLIKSHWGPEPGSMISVEADRHTVDRLLMDMETRTKHRIEIACVNGPKSHVLVASKVAIGALAKVLETGNIKFKTLDVTHGFHSSFTEPLLPGLEELARQLKFNQPSIPLFRCSKEEENSSITPFTITEHTRQPVYFDKAISRINETFGSCFWLEAGSSSPIMAMIRRALDSGSSNGSQNYRALALSEPSAWSSVCNATEHLWDCGHDVRFWPLHRSQSPDYEYVSMPSYAFERTKHWLEWSPLKSPLVPTPSQSNTTTPRVRTLLSMKESGQDKTSKGGEVEFDIDPRSDEWIVFVEGHAVLDVPLCPAPLYIELISRAIKLLEYSNSDAKPVVSVEKLTINMPLGCASDRTIRLRLMPQQSLSSQKTWIFEFVSTTEPGQSWESHALGRAVLSAKDDADSYAELERYQRLLGSSRLELLQQDPESEAIQGSFLYKSFSRVVSYADYYKGVKCVRARGHEIAGLVRLPDVSGAAKDMFEKTMTNPLAIDNFIQVAGVHANLIGACPASDVFVCTNVDHVRSSQPFLDMQQDMTTFEVFTTFTSVNDRKMTYDIYACEARTHKVLFVVLGALFTRVNMKSMTRILENANKPSYKLSGAKSEEENQTAFKRVAPQEISGPLGLSNNTSAHKAFTISPVSTVRHRDVGEELRTLLQAVTEIPSKDFVDTSSFDDVGIDSLMITEVLSEICKHFRCDISMDTFATLTDMRKLISHLESVLLTTLVSNDFGNDDNSSSSDDISDLTDMSSVSPTPKGPTRSDGMEKLNQLVCHHLEIERLLPSTNLADQGLDSLLCMELASDIQKLFGVQCDMNQLNMESTMQDLWNLVLACNPVGLSQRHDLEILPAAETGLPVQSKSTKPSKPANLDLGVHDIFKKIRGDYDIYSRQTGFHGFWDQVYPLQSKLVLLYVLDAFKVLGYDITSMAAGTIAPTLRYSATHTKLMPQLYNILVDGSLLESRADQYVRTDSTIDQQSSSELLARLVAAFPQHEKEHRLLHAVGEQLGNILLGTADPIRILFASKENRKLLEEVYARGPMYGAISGLLCSFMTKAFANADGIINILELGGGTGGTTKHVTKALDEAGIVYNYTFTDISGSLVNAAKRNLFPGRDNFEYATIDIEKEPAQQFKSRYHMVLSTNCIHATSNLAISLQNIRKLLRPDGFCSLVEFTRNMFWFDIVFGVLDGWWLFNDGRKHVLASEWFWNNAMKTAGFPTVDWTEGDSEESKTLRIITAFNSRSQKSEQSVVRKTDFTTFSTVWKEVNGLSLGADVYLPSDANPGNRPVALLIHGGGHCLLTRNDVDRRQIRILLDKGFLPVSFDYRLCPEVNIIDGPMSDACDALSWARYDLPRLSLPCQGLTVDGGKVAAIGWSAGGTLAMSLGFTTIARNIAPPEAVLAFYCPTDFEDVWWQTPCFPKEIHGSPDEGLDFLEAVQDHPLIGYSPQARAGLGSKWSTKDARWRIISHMNWNAQHLPVLLNGLPGPHAREKSGKAPDVLLKELALQPQPSKERVQSISPLAQINTGTYKVPTVLVHGKDDDLIPWQQSQRTFEALRRQGVPSELIALDGAEHLFDAFGLDRQGGGTEAVSKAYDWLARHCL